MPDEVRRVRMRSSMASTTGVCPMYSYHLSYGSCDLMMRDFFLVPVIQQRQQGLPCVLVDGLQDKVIKDNLVVLFEFLKKLLCDALRDGTLELIYEVVDVQIEYLHSEPASLMADGTGKISLAVAGPVSYLRINPQLATASSVSLVRFLAPPHFTSLKSNLQKSLVLLSRCTVFLSSRWRVPVSMSLERIVSVLGRSCIRIRSRSPNAFNMYVSRHQ